MGCGKRNFGDDWIHIDQENFDHIDYNNIFDFPISNIDLIYASHLISYFDRETVIHLLSYWREKLNKKGILRLAVPDFKAMCKLYSQGLDLNYFLGPLYGRMNSGGSLIFHRTCYDQKSLSNLLSEVGYVNIRLWDHRKVSHGNFDDHSQAYIPHMDKENGSLISLNIECQKA